MRTTKYFLMAVMSTGLVAGLYVFGAVDDAKPKYDIGEIMEKAHKGGKKSLMALVVTGKASDEQKKQLLEYYEELAKNKPEKGDIKDWQKRTNALVKAAKNIVNGKQGADKELQKAANCKGCHQAHKGD
jgi:cytochrome c553